MADFLDSVKKGVSAAVSRTSWEAQKQMRVRSKQTEVDQLLEQREKLLNDLAQTAIDLYQKSALTLLPRQIRAFPSSLPDQLRSIRRKSSPSFVPLVAILCGQTLCIAEIAGPNFVDSGKLWYNDRRFIRERKEIASPWSYKTGLTLFI